MCVLCMYRIYIFGYVCVMYVHVMCMFFLSRLGFCILFGSGGEGAIVKVEVLGEELNFLTD